MTGAALYTFEPGGIAYARYIFDFTRVLMQTGALKVKTT